MLVSPQSQPKLSKTSWAVVTHEYFKGSGQEFREWLIRHGAGGVLYVAHRFYYAPEPYSYFDYNVAGERVGGGKTWTWPRWQFIRHVGDFFYALWVIWRTPGIIDYYVGVNSYNALLGLLLRRLGRVRMVVFFTIDYAMEDRFGWEPLNWLYRIMDRWAFFGSDFVWNVSERMGKERCRRLGLRAEKKPQVVVPIGIPWSEAQAIPVPRREWLLIYSGSIDKESGVSLLIEAAPRLVNLFPVLEIRVIGDGPLLAELQRRVAELGLQRTIHFMGFVDTTNERRRWLSLVKEGTLGIAPYTDSTTTYKRYSDVTKPKDYMACGLPIVVTDVVLIAEDVRRYNLGRVISYTTDSLVEAVAELLRDGEERRRIEHNLNEYSRDTTWGNIFQRALRSINISI